MITKYRDDLTVDMDLAVTGEPGRDGVDGRDGVNGKDGADGRAGEPARGWEYTGEWSASRQYVVNDVCSAGGGSFVCTKDNRDREPPNHRFWGVVATAGRDGRDGERGGAGPRGMPSPVPFSANTAKATFDSAVVRGNVVRVSADNHVDLAVAHGTDSALALAVGLSNGAYGPGQQGSYTIAGPFTCDSWNFTPGVSLYADPSVPGGLTETYPSTANDFVVIMGVMLTPTTINLSISYKIQIGA